MNDGSNDNGASEKIALSYGKSIRYYLKENGGVSSALNYAFSKMEGEWFSWLSHDDLYYPEKIEKQIELINELLADNPNINLKKITVRCATESIDKDGKVIRRPSYKGIPKREKTIDTILNNISNYRLSGCSFLLPAACVEDIGGFTERIRTVSDVEYWYRLLFRGYEFYCLTDQILVKNRSHGKQVGKTKVDLFNKELADLFVWIADTMNQNSEFSTIYNNEKLYFALIKRKCFAAAKYVKENFLRKMVGNMKYQYIYPLCAIRYAIVGSLRNIARYIYRKICVK